MINKQNVFIIIYFLALAIINFIVYIKITDYLYICAGITKKDAKKFIGEHATNGQRYLVKWMRYKTTHPKEFEIMLALCEMCIFISAISVAFIIAVLAGANDKIIKIATIILPIISVATSLFGFSYGKKAEQKLGGSSLSDKYMLNDDEASSEDFNDKNGPYSKIGDEQAQQNNDMYGNYFNKNGETDKRYRLCNYILRVITVLIILAIGFSVILFNRSEQPIKINNITESTTVNENENNDNHSAISAKRMKQILEDEGFSPFHRSEEIYGDFVLSDLVVANEGGKYFAYYVLDTQETAVAFQETVEYEINSIYKKDEKNDKEHKEYKNGFEFYSLETDESCATVIRTENNVIYAHCDTENLSWLNDFLTSLGFSNIFNIKKLNTNAFAFMIVFIVLAILSRFAFSWIKRLSYVASGQTLRSVEEHYEQVKSDKAPYKKELQWLVEVSPRPLLTKVLYCSFYALISLAIIGFIISIIDIFVPVFNDFLNKTSMALIVLCILSGFCNILFNQPIIYFMSKGKKK